MKAMDPAKATEILNNISTPGEDLSGGLETLRMLEPKNIAAFLLNEHPQTAAIVLAHLDEEDRWPMSSKNYLKTNEQKSCFDWRR